MDGGWPRGGAWMVVATSAGVDWRVAVAALAAAAEVPVAAVTVGGGLAGADLAAVLEIAEPGELGLDNARDLVQALAQAHDLVLVGGDAGPLVPVGRDGWTLADLATALGAPAVLVTGPGPDAVNHTTLALEALAGRGIAAAVVTIGDVDEEPLPVAPAGRIPAGAEAEGAFFEPMLRARPADTAPAAPPARTSAAATVSGKRLVLGLVAVFAVMVLMVCGMAWWGGRNTTASQARFNTGFRPGPALSATIAPPPPTTAPRRSAAEVCPENAGRITVARPDAATTARVNAAWQRIEKWLAAHAPAGARALRKPAPAAQIDGLQRRMSVAFPADLVASLRRHDGVGSHGLFALPPFFTPETLTDILADWRVNCDVLANTDTSFAAAWWDPAFVPFAAAGDGGSLVVDQRAGGHGRVGEFYPEDGTRFEHWPASVTALLEQTATALETGKPYAGHYRPRATEQGTLDWAVER